MRFADLLEYLMLWARADIRFCYQVPVFCLSRRASGCSPRTSRGEWDSEAICAGWGDWLYPGFAEMFMPLKFASLMILLAYVVDNVAAIFFGVSFLMAVVVAPAIEESTRYYVAGCLCWTAGPRTAAMIGLLIGLGEVGTKTFEAALFNPNFHPLLSSGPILVSIPIQVALSLAFYSIWSGRWLKTFGLHVLINGIGWTIGRGLWGKMALADYMATNVAIITALSVAIGGLALWRMRLRREGAPA